MALVYTEIDNIIDNAPDVDVDVPFFDELKDNLEKLEAGGTGGIIEGGSSNFAGTAGVVITFAAAEDDTDYRVNITPTESPGGNLGEFWAIKTTTTLTVYNSGTATTAFDWSISR